MVLVAISVYYLYRYFFGLDYTIQFYKDNWYAKVNDEQYEAIKSPKPFLLSIQNYDNAVLDVYLANANNLRKELDICNENFEIDPNGEYHCFNLSFYHMDKEKINVLRFACIDNCTNSEGTPSELYIHLYTKNLAIDHTQKNPFIYDYIYGDALQIAVNNNLFEGCLYFFTPIIYISSEIFSTKTNIYINTYLTEVSTRGVFSPSRNFFSMNLGMYSDCDVYERKYKTLLDTLSTIGGLFSPIKLIFELLISFYSNLENNAEITKSVFLKKDVYEYKVNNKIPLEKKLDIEIHNDNRKSGKENNFDIEIPDEVKIKRKQFNINKKEQFFFSFCNCCKKRRTMKILNLCNDFIQNYLSAENIIFNMILFENYFKDNPIKIKKNTYLNQIEKEIEPNYYTEDTNLLNELNEK